LRFKTKVGIALWIAYQLSHHLVSHDEMAKKRLSC